MKWTLVVFLTAVAAAAVYGQSSVSSPPITPKFDTTTLTTDPTTSPPVTTTTEVTSTSQTTPAETTTAAPNTTQSPETTTAPPATTTEAPSTTSEPTTTSKPPGNWVLYYPNTNEPCIIVSMTMKFKIHDHENKVVEVPKDAAVSGSCDVVTTLSEPSDQQHLQLSFNTTDGSYSVDMLFEADEESKGSEKLVIKVKEWKLNYELTNKTEISSSVVEPVLRFGGNMTYHCDYNRKFKMTYEDSLEASYIDIQAFVTKDANLGTESCEEDKTNDIVPIAVGCALAALVIIVLIAYLIGRRRSRQKGYQSV